MATLTSSRLALVFAFPILVIGQETLGCFHYNYAYADAAANSTGVTLNATSECQARCAATPGCLAFTYWTMRPQGNCDLTFTALTLVSTEVNDVGVSGPPHCPPGPNIACTAVPDATFPGKTAAESNAAFPGGVVPTNAQCWPRDEVTGYPVLCSPQNITVVEDTALGWTGSCLGLKQVAPSTTCEEFCLQTPLCSVWSQVNQTPPQCWTGVYGEDCYNPAGPDPTRSQRVMHGTYRVLKNLQGIQIMGLTNMFGTDAFENALEAPSKCRLYCIASLGCNYWQYSSLSGCWVEDPSKAKVAYPLTTDPEVSNTNTDAANAITDGEYIQHVCSVSTAVVTSTTGEVVTGSTSITVADFTGIDVGDLLTLWSGAQSETRTVTAVAASGGRRLAAGVVSVNAPFASMFPAGSIVTASPDLNPPTTPLSTTTYVTMPTTTTFTTTTIGAASSFPWWAWVLCLVAALFACGAVVGALIMFCRKKGRASKSSRSMKDPNGSMHDYPPYGDGDYDREDAPLKAAEFPTQMASVYEEPQRQAIPFPRPTPEALSQPLQAPAPVAYQAVPQVQYGGSYQPVVQRPPQVMPGTQVLPGTQQAMPTAPQLYPGYY